MPQRGAENITAEYQFLQNINLHCPFDRNVHNAHSENAIYTLLFDRSWTESASE